MKSTLLTLMALGLTLVTAPAHAQKKTHLKCEPDSIPPYLLECAAMRDSSGQGGGPQLRVDSSGLGGGPQMRLVSADLMLPTFRVFRSKADSGQAGRRVLTLTAVATLVLVVDSVRPAAAKAAPH